MGPSHMIQNRHLGTLQLADNGKLASPRPSFGSTLTPPTGRSPRMPSSNPSPMSSRRQSLATPDLNMGTLHLPAPTMQHDGRSRSLSPRPRERLGRNNRATARSVSPNASIS